jgi:hypothetical protein
VLFFSTAVVSGEVEALPGQQLNFSYLLMHPGSSGYRLIKDFRSILRRL